MTARKTAVLAKAWPPLASLPCSHTDYESILANLFLKAWLLVPRAPCSFSFPLAQSERCQEGVRRSCSQAADEYFFLNEEQWNCSGSFFLESFSLFEVHDEHRQAHELLDHHVSPAEYGCFLFIFF